MEFLKLLGSAKAWEIVVTLVGGYLAAKDIEKLSRRQMFYFIVAASLLSMTFTDFAIPWLIESERLSKGSGNNLRPLMLIVAAAISLKILDLLYVWIVRLKTIEFSINWFKK